MRFIFDTNVIIATFISQGYCHDVFEYACKNHEVIVSDYILQEVEKTLKKKFHFSKGEIDEVIDYITHFCVIIDTVTALPKRACRDKTDDAIIAVAFQEDAHALFTGDKDLLVLKKYQYIPILAPKNFWQYESGNVN